MSGEITKPSETTVTEEISDEPVHVEDVIETEIYSPGHGQMIPLTDVRIKFSLKNDGRWRRFHS